MGGTVSQVVSQPTLMELVSIGHRNMGRTWEIGETVEVNMFNFIQHLWLFKWHSYTITKTVQSIDEMNAVQMMWGWGDRTWWVVESVLLHSPDKGYWACPRYLPQDVKRLFFLFKTISSGRIVPRVTIDFHWCLIAAIFPSYDKLLMQQVSKMLIPMIFYYFIFLLLICYDLLSNTTYH